MKEQARQALEERGFGQPAGEEQLHGGLTSQVLRLTFTSGRSAVY